MDRWRQDRKALPKGPSNKAPPPSPTGSTGPAPPGAPVLALGSSSLPAWCPGAGDGRRRTADGRRRRAWSPGAMSRDDSTTVSRTATSRRRSAPCGLCSAQRLGTGSPLRPTCKRHLACSLPGPVARPQGGAEGQQCPRSSSVSASRAPEGNGVRARRCRMLRRLQDAR